MIREGEMTVSDNMRSDEHGAETPANPDRRAALAKMGKFAGVTAPAVVALLTTNSAEAWATSGKGGGRDHPKGPLGWLLGILFH